ncbi:hypothetical protein CLV62_10687 [Dysgonomonas alginatilytica]|uniref:Uncharacterized protein n=1 Tax=Dysgonomonas alginatilytica TaxID=1605892 RepID=A0A2V3PS47_9BACT|nr:hypothetical protein [Dysgonomonas alginatilytica]PXV65914.1 hypothetical protein CLV62_10687 [Dysgonomonas alginatilytica]
MASGKENRYGGITKEKITLILDKLKQSGASVTGTNPWNVDVHSNGVKLQGRWNESISELQITVVDRNFYVPYSKVWDKINPLISQI